jgi:beta-barrel assembly-enhancing protease
MRTFSVLRRVLGWSLISLFLLQEAAAQMAPLPDLGDPAQDSLTPAQEKHIAEEVLRDVRFHEPTYLDDPEVEEYLSAVGHRLASGGVTERDNYQFFVLKDPTINAFSMPGGIIGVHTALIVTTQTESELAAVLSHEMGHVEQHHIARMLARAPNTTAMVLASVLLAVLVGRNSPDAAGAALIGGQAAAIQRQLSFSRDYEREADRMGMQILSSAGFDPQGMIDFFQRMYQQTRAGENPAFGYLRTHPLTQDRIVDMEGRVHQLPPHKQESSVNYILMRQKIEVLSLGGRLAVERLTDRPFKTRLEQIAHWYGLGRAYLDLRNFPEAQKALAQLQALKPESSMVDMLAADIAQGEKHFEEAARLCHAAQAAYPVRRSLVYCEAEAWMDAGKPDEALKAVDRPLRTNRDDYRLYMLQSKAATTLGRNGLAHRAQAEVYVLQGDLEAAVDQLKLAQRDRSGDYVEQASIDARLRELRNLQDEDKDKKKKKDGNDLL